MEITSKVPNQHLCLHGAPLPEPLQIENFPWGSIKEDIASCSGLDGVAWAALPLISVTGVRVSGYTTIQAPAAAGQRWY